MTDLLQEIDEESHDELCIRAPIGLVLSPWSSAMNVQTDAFKQPFSIAGSDVAMLGRQGCPALAVDSSVDEKTASSELDIAALHEYANRLCRKTGLTVV